MEITDLENPLAAVSIGVIATAVLDCWALVLNRLLGQPVTNWGHVGRWVVAMPSGVFRHDSIGARPPVPFERAVGWVAHYAIGIAYAVVYVAGLRALSMTPSASSAIVFGLATVLAPWLILQPGLGMGLFAARTPNPNRIRALNMLAHIVFGLGLYVGSRVLALS